MEQDHRIEPLAREVAAQLCPHLKWDEFTLVAQANYRCVARHLLSRESKRVGPLVEALDKAIQCAKWQYEMRTKEAPDSPPHSLFWELDTVLAAYRAIDAQPAPEPSLADVAAALVQSTHGAPDGYMWTRAEHVDALKSALAREREKGAGK